VERNAAAAEKTEAQAHVKAKITLKMIFQAIFTNRILLVIFLFMILQQAYYFLIQMTSTYLFKYYFNAFQYYGIFTTAFNFPAVGGVVAGVIWRNYLKDLKKAFVTAGIAHVAMLGIITLLFRSLTWWSFAALIGVAQFFAGMCEAYYLPMFGIAADWGALKSGKRQDGLIMSTYTMSISIGMNISTLLRTFLLAQVGYNAKLYVTGVKPSFAVLQMLANMNSLIPFILSALCIAIIAFFYNVNEEKHKEIIAQLRNIK
jgi:Na+/melibiose symporter-like transporter